LIVLDSYAWIEYFLGSETGETVRGHLKTEQVITPSIVLAEVARKYLKQQMKESEVLRRLIFISANSEIAEINTSLSLSAASAYSELLEKARAEKLKKPSLADGIVLATGRAFKATILTGDEHFRGLGGVTYIRQ
jgi:predicted nucleic acid-binding protein